MKCSRRVLLVLCLLPVVPARAAFNAILWDNDALSPRRTDAYYTNGFVYHWVSDPVAPGAGRNWAACPGLGALSRQFDDWLIPASGPAPFRHSWEVGQVIQTPLDKDANPPDPEDQPYAGLLYAGCTYHLKTGRRAESMGLVAGILGPWALAGESQDAAHHVVGAREAQGWAGQLRNEIVLNLRYDRQQVLREAALGSQGVSIFDTFGFEFGTLEISASAGLSVLLARDPDAVFGFNPNYLGRYPTISGDRATGFYVMTTLQATAVMRDLFLNGNTWVDSPAAVDHEPLLGSAQLMVGYGFRCWALQLGLSVSTRTFQQQDLEWPRYGSLAVSWGCGA